MAKSMLKKELMGMTRLEGLQERESLRKDKGVAWGEAGRTASFLLANDF